MDNALLFPLFVQVGLTFTVLLSLAIQRVTEASRDNEVKAKVAAGRKDVYRRSAMLTAENLENLFETPVLFYTAVAVSLATGVVTDAMVTLAWIFVIARIVHTGIHTTLNIVLFRFFVFLIAFLALLGLWIALALGLTG
ncbi:MAG: MAPEG family protein [Parvularcula sp.]|jgi:hypothetical protein|nr:MAPEG family protein [Parvularcula sp.]